MNERQERIERLAERWFAAQATDAEERELRDWFRQAAGVPDSLREAQILFGGLDALAGERSRERWKPRRAGRILPLWGIAAAVVLGIGRAIGEAMAIIMVAGNVANMPGLFQSVRFLTTAVSSEMAYASGLQRQALFSIALVLFLFIMLINIVLNTLLKRKKG